LQNSFIDDPVCAEMLRKFILNKTFDRFSSLVLNLELDQTIAHEHFILCDCNIYLINFIIIAVSVIRETNIGSSGISVSVTCNSATKITSWLLFSNVRGFAMWRKLHSGHREYYQTIVLYLMFLAVAIRERKLN